MYIYIYTHVPIISHRNSHHKHITLGDDQVNAACWAPAPQRTVIHGKMERGCGVAGPGGRADGNRSIEFILMSGNCCICYCYIHFLAFFFVEVELGYVIISDSHPGRAFAPFTGGKYLDQNCFKPSHIPISIVTGTHATHRFIFSVDHGN